MKKETRLYNVILPVWLLWLFPQTWLVVLPGNLVIDALVFFLALAALGRRDKGALVKRHIWRLWLYGFLADFAGVGWLLAGFFTAYGDSAWSRAITYVSHDAFGHPLAFFWTLMAVGIAGFCIYRLDCRALAREPSLTDRERRRIALVMAVVTAPWTFFIPVY